MNQKSEQNSVFERIERTEDSTSLGINKHTSILWNDTLHVSSIEGGGEPSRASAGADVQMRLDTNLIVNGSVRLRRSSSTSTGN